MTTASSAAAWDYGIRTGRCNPGQVLSVIALWLGRQQKFQLKISTAAVVFPVCANLRFRGWGGGERSGFDSYHSSGDNDGKS
jgi:hypothetical protein